MSNTTTAPAARTAANKGKKQCKSCRHFFPATKFPTIHRATGIRRGTTCRACLVAAPKGTRPCGDACRNAKCDDCKCACDGANHGQDLLIFAA